MHIKSKAGEKNSERLSFLVLCFGYNRLVGREVSVLVLCSGHVEQCFGRHSLMCLKSHMSHVSKESHASELYFRHMRLLKQSRLVGRNVKRCFGRQSLMCPKSLMSHASQEFHASELCFGHMRLFGRLFGRNVERCFGRVLGSRAIADNTGSFAGI